MTSVSLDQIAAIRELFPLCAVCGKPIGDAPIQLVRNNSRAAHDECVAVAQSPVAA